MVRPQNRIQDLKHSTEVVKIKYEFFCLEKISDLKFMYEYRKNDSIKKTRNVYNILFFNIKNILARVVTIFRTSY